MSATAIPQRASRGQLAQRWLLGAVLATLLGVMVLATWTFAWPSAADRGAYAIAPVDDFELGSVTSYLITEQGALQRVEDIAARFAIFPNVRGNRSGRALVYVVRFPDGDFRVFSGASTHLGQVVLWEGEGPTWLTDRYVGVFIEPAHSEQWTIDGVRLFGPAPRDLDRYRWQIDNGVLVVELDELERGPSGSHAPPPYDVTSEGWATSGWPSN